MSSGCFEKWLEDSSALCLYHSQAWCPQGYPSPKCLPNKVHRGCKKSILLGRVWIFNLCRLGVWVWLCTVPAMPLCLFWVFSYFFIHLSSTYWATTMCQALFWMLEPQWWWREPESGFQWSFYIQLVCVVGGWGVEQGTYTLNTERNSMHKIPLWIYCCD